MAHAFGVDDDAHISSAILEFTSHGWSRSGEHTFPKSGSLLESAKDNFSSLG
jgi:hypothetical protein